MARNFYLQSLPAVGELVALPEPEARHAVRVLRLGRLDSVCLLDGAGMIAEAELAEVSVGGRRINAICRIQKKWRTVRPVPEVNLYVAPPRSRQMDALVQAATALGVAAIVPVRCRRSVAEPDMAGSERWRRQAITALKQSGNPFLPEFPPPGDFFALVRNAGPGFFGETVGLNQDDGLDSFEVPANCSLWIGPEGGFASEEKQALLRLGLRPLMVGCWTLRVEVAVPALLGSLIGAKVGI